MNSLAIIKNEMVDREESAGGKSSDSRKRHINEEEIASNKRMITSVWADIEQEVPKREPVDAVDADDACSNEELRGASSQGSISDDEPYQSIRIQTLVPLVKDEPADTVGSLCNDNYGSPEELKNGMAESVTEREFINKKIASPAKPNPVNLDSNLKGQDRHSIPLVKKEPLDAVKPSSPNNLTYPGLSTTKNEHTEREMPLSDLSAGVQLTSNTPLVGNILNAEETERKQDVDLAFKSISIILNENTRLNKELAKSIQEKSLMMQEIEQLKKKLRSQELKMKWKASLAKERQQNSSDTQQQNEDDLRDKNTNEYDEETSDSSDTNNDSDLEIENDAFFDSEKQQNNGDAQLKKLTVFSGSNQTSGSQGLKVNTTGVYVRKTRYRATGRKISASCQECCFDFKGNMPHTEQPNTTWLSLEESGLELQQITCRMILCIFFKGCRVTHQPCLIQFRTLTRKRTMSFYRIKQNGEVYDKPFKSNLTCKYCLQKNIFVKCDNITSEPMLRD